MLEKIILIALKQELKASRDLNTSVSQGSIIESHNLLTTDIYSIHISLILRHSNRLFRLHSN